MRVVVAPNAFKGSLTAAAAASAAAAGVRAVLPDAQVVMCPVADGGDGSVDALIESGYEPQWVEVRGPTGRPVSALIARRGTTAVVEIANTCGLLLLPGGHLEPMASSSVGLGDAVRAALDGGAEHIVLCLGGSASTDGGAGLLTALGAVLRDGTGRPLAPSGAGLHRVATIDVSGLHPRIRGARFTVATDVTSPLLGPGGAARVFAPQKGASPEQVELLEDGLRGWSRALAEATGRDESATAGAGAAGGTAVAAISVLDADVVSGADFVAEAIGLRRACLGADLVMTGEGALDAQSLLGKGALEVVRLAVECRVPAVMVCGRIDLTADQLRELGVEHAASLDRLSADPMTGTAELMTEATATVVRDWLAGRAQRPRP